jgi:hypothetical protein
MVSTTGILASLQEGSVMVNRILAAAAVGVLLIGIAARPSKAANAWANSEHREYLTFSAPIALPGVVLAAGTYVFELPTESAHQIVRVSSKDGKQIYFTRYTREVRRPNKGAVPHVTFGEAAPNAARPVNTWFPQGQESGRQFIY